jgi:hypothetical protein
VTPAPPAKAKWDASDGRAVRPDHPVRQDRDCIHRDHQVRRVHDCIRRPGYIHQDWEGRRDRASRAVQAVPDPYKSDVREPGSPDA